MVKSKYAGAFSIVGSLTITIAGYETGVMSGAQLFIQEDLKINDTHVQLLIGILNVCALVGSLTAGRVSDYVGRRRTISFAACIFLTGSLLMSLARSFAMLVSGRCVAGVGVGFALMIAPVYAAEISPAKSRGFLSAMPDLCGTVGILIGYVANYYLGKLPLAYGWRVMLGLGALPSAVLAVGVLALPESPRWLVMQGRVEEALNVVQRICDTPEEADVLWRLATPEMRSDGRGIWKELFLHPTPTVRRILTASLGILFFQHVSGINAVQVYGARVFKAAGVASKQKVLQLTVVVGVIKTLFIPLATLLVDRVGRRPLYPASMSGVIASFACLCASLTVVGRGGAPWATALAIASVFTFVAFFSVGLGPITLAYGSEVFPLRLRAQGVSAGVALNRIANAGVAMTFLTLADTITMGGAFFFYACCNVVAATYFYFLCPETQGLALEEIQEVFSHGWRMRRLLDKIPSAETPVSKRNARR